MFWIFGRGVIPRGAIGLMAGACACLAFGTILEIAGAVAGLVPFLWVGWSLLAVGGVLALLTLRRAALPPR